MKKYKKR